MKTKTIKIAKSERKQAWGEHLIEAGYERDQFDNKYRKRIVTWEMGGIEYTASTVTDAEGDLIITLTEYKR